MDQHGMARRSPQRDLDGAELSAEYLSGATLKALAQKHGCSVSVITRHLDQTETPRRTGKRNPPQLDIDSITKDYRNGSTIQQLADRYGCGYRTISTALKNAGVPTRR